MAQSTFHVVSVNLKKKESKPRINYNVERGQLNLKNTNELEKEKRSKLIICFEHREQDSPSASV